VKQTRAKIPPEVTRVRNAATGEIKKYAQVKCRKCGGRMADGKAMAQTYTAGMPDFPGMDVHSAGQTISPGGPGKLIDVVKCESCGWSVT